MKRVLYAAVIAFIMLLIFVFSVLAGQITRRRADSSQQAATTTTGNVFYGDPNGTLPAVTTAPPAPSVTGQSAIATQVFTDVFGNTQTDVNGNPLYVVPGTTAPPEQPLTTGTGTNGTTVTTVTTTRAVGLVTLNTTATTVGTQAGGATTQLTLVIG